MQELSSAGYRKTAHFRLFSLILCAILGALTFALKVAMASLPNIEPVTLMLILCTLVFGWRAMATTAIYVLLEGLIFGFSTWWIPYLYAWPLLVVLTMAFRRHKHRVFWAVFAAIYGFVFGFLFLPVNYFVYNMANNPDALLVYIANDIPFNAIHAAGNFVVVLVLLPPLRRGMQMAVKRIFRTE